MQTKIPKSSNVLPSHYTNLAKQRLLKMGSLWMIRARCVYNIAIIAYNCILSKHYILRGQKQQAETCSYSGPYRIMLFTDRIQLYYHIHKKVQLSLPVHTLKPYKRSWGMAPLILNLGTRWRRLTSRPGRINPGKDTRYQLNRRLGEPQRPSLRFGEQKNLLFPPELEPPACPARILVIKKTTLPRHPVFIHFI
jgi:hypothetical protein